MSQGSKNPPPHNPYASAAGAYDSHAQAHTPNQRELEARILLKAAKAFKELQDNWEDVTQEQLDDVLTYNRQVWMMFVDTAIEDEDPERSNSLRSNIANLGNFIFNHTLGILADPKKEKLDILIEINREIAAGLMTNPHKQNDGGNKEMEDSAEQPASDQHQPLTDTVS
jgi:flagellar biosynthesis activator protein FlaF